MGHKTRYKASTIQILNRTASKKGITASVIRKRQSLAIWFIHTQRGKFSMLKASNERMENHWKRPIHRNQINHRSKLTSATSVERFSRLSTPWQFISKCLRILAPGHLCVRFVAKVFVFRALSVDTRLSTQPTNLINVRSVGKPSTVLQRSRRISELTAMSRSSLARSVAKDFIKKATYEITCSFIPERSLTSVLSARRRLTSSPT